MCPNSDLSSIGGDGEEVCGAIEGADGHPATVPAEGDILHAGRRGSTVEQVEVVDSCFTGEPGVGH